MSNIKVCMLTVGHSPRTDLVPDFKGLLSPKIEIMEMGALDQYTSKQVEDAFLAHGDEETMVTRLREGNMVTLSAVKMIPLIQIRIHDAIAQGAQAIVILCTGKFPLFESSKPLIRPYTLLHSVVPQMVKGMKVAAVFPYEAYAEGMAQSWQSDGINVVYQSIAPSQVKSGDDVVKLFKDRSPEIVILDCIGYTQQISFQVSEAMNVPVVQPKCLIANTLNSIFYYS